MEEYIGNYLEEDAEAVSVINSLEKILKVIDDSGELIDLDKEVVAKKAGKETTHKFYDVVKIITEKLKPMLDNIVDPALENRARQLFMKARIYIVSYESKKPNEKN